MKWIKTIKLIFLFFYITSAYTNAQGVGKQLDGTWKLDSVQIVKNSDNSVVAFNKFKQNPYFGLFDELIFKGDDLTVVESGNKMNGKVQISNDKLSFAFTPAPFEAQYQIKNEQLFLEHRVSYPGEGHPDNDIYTVLTKYIKQ